MESLHKISKDFLKKIHLKMFKNLPGREFATTLINLQLNERQKDKRLENQIQR